MSIIDVIIIKNIGLLRSGTLRDFHRFMRKTVIIGIEILFAAYLLYAYEAHSEEARAVMLHVAAEKYLPEDSFQMALMDVIVGGGPEFTDKMVL